MFISEVLLFQCLHWSVFLIPRFRLTIESRVRDEELSDGTIRVSSLVSGLGKCVPTAVNKYLTD